MEEQNIAIAKAEDHQIYINTERALELVGEDTHRERALRHKPTSNRVQKPAKYHK